MELGEKLAHTSKEKEEFREWLRQKNKEQLTCMHYCSYNGIIEGLGLLIKNQVPIEANMDGLGPVHFAAQNNTLKSLVFFRDNNVPLESTDSKGGTPLHWACYSGNDEAVSFLTAWNIQINPKDNLGYTPLHLAVLSGSSRSVKRLLTKGADRSAIDNEGKTALDYAKEQKNENIADLLVLFLGFDGLMMRRKTDRQQHLLPNHEHQPKAKALRWRQEFPLQFDAHAGSRHRFRIPFCPSM